MASLLPIGKTFVLASAFLALASCDNAEDLDTLLSEGRTVTIATIAQGNWTKACFSGPHELEPRNVTSGDCWPLAEDVGPSGFILTVMLGDDTCRWFRSKHSMFHKDNMQTICFDRETDADLRFTLKDRAVTIL